MGSVASTIMRGMVCPSHEKPVSVNSGKEMVCCITLELPFDPVTAEDGRVYERKAIQEYFKGKSDSEIKSPYTRKPMGKRLFPAMQHKNMIEILIENKESNWTERDKKKF